VSQIEHGRLPYSEIKVRRMRSADVDRVLSIAATLSTAPHWERSAYEAAVLDDSRRVMLVAEAGGLVLGFAVAAIVAPEGELESIAVAADSQRMGVAAKLLAELIAELGKLGVDTLNLEVRESNQPAITFYHRAGFFEIARRRDYYRDPIEDALLLRRAVNSD
jgi:ribosomal-protein-alanine N-acetyltransferase